MHENVNELPRARRWAEMLGLYVGLPTAWVGLDRVGFPSWVVVPLVVAAGVVLWWLLRSPGFEREVLTRAVTRDEVVRVLAIFGILATLMALSVLLLEPGRIAWMPRTVPLLWLGLVVFYPLLSVIPQELLYRVAFVHRYGELFSTSRARILTSAALFAYAHIVYLNVPSLVLTFIGGLLFASTYERTRSLPLLTLEHTLYGLAIFTLGLEPYFLHPMWQERVGGP